MSLWKHQQETVEFGLPLPALNDHSSPGTGKTRAHLELFNRRAEAGDSDKLLVVCPRSLMVPAWAHDIRTFFGDKYKVAVATAANRQEALGSDADIYIINTDGVKALAKESRTVSQRRFGDKASLVIDEATAFKNPQSMRSKAARQLSSFFAFRANLTGTPNPNTVMELWHQQLLVDGGQRLGSNYYALRNQLQDSIPQNGFMRWVDKPEAVELVHLLIKDMTIRHDFDQVMDIPETTNRYLYFDLEPKLLNQYQAMEAAGLLELEGADVTAINAAVQVNKLLQIASGAVYSAHGATNFLNSQRYELISDLVDERDHSIVFFSWEHQRRFLADVFAKRKYDFAVIDGSVPDTQRNKIVEDFQKGRYKELLLHPKTGAHGLTLTKARTVIWASPRYEADYFEQGIHRVRRGGQTQQTENIMLCANETREDAVYEALQGKITKMQLLNTLTARAA